MDNQHRQKKKKIDIDKSENVVAKGEIALKSNFSFCHNVFKIASYGKGKKRIPTGD